MKRLAAALVSCLLSGGSAMAQFRGHDHRRDDETPQFIEPPLVAPRAGEPDRWQNRPGDANPFATTPGAPNPFATTPGAPPNSQPFGRSPEQAGGASGDGGVRAAPNPNRANLLPEERRYGSGDGGARRR